MEKQSFEPGMEITLRTLRHAKPQLNHRHQHINSKFLHARYLSVAQCPSLNASILAIELGNKKSSYF